MVFYPRPCVRGDYTHRRTGRCIGYFNPRPCVRGDYTGGRLSGMIMGFQSTPLHEGRPMTSAPLLIDRYFNPRPCTRGDPAQCQSVLPPSISIHAPARGATAKTDKQQSISQTFSVCFNHIFAFFPSQTLFFTKDLCIWVCESSGLFMIDLHSH